MTKGKPTGRGTAKAKMPKQTSFGKAGRVRNPAQHAGRQALRAKAQGKFKSGKQGS